MKIVVYNQEGKETGEALLPKEIFDVKLNPDLLHQVVVSQMANRRQRIAHTKTRGEVRGGGRKPWRQKGTGRARAGSIRSPLWRKGGVTFGPRKEKVFKKDIPRKMKRKALLMALSEKARNNLLVLLDKMEIEGPKTKLIVRIIENLKLKIENFKKGSSLIILPDLNKNLIFAARNIPETAALQAKDLNALALLSFRYLIMPKESIKVIKETFLK